MNILRAPRNSNIEDIGREFDYGWREMAKEIYWLRGKEEELQQLREEANEK
jgi:hypothetical protein